MLLKRWIVLTFNDCNVENWATEKHPRFGWNITSTKTLFYQISYFSPWYMNSLAISQNWQSTYAVVNTYVLSLRLPGDGDSRGGLGMWTKNVWEVKFVMHILYSIQCVVVPKKWHGAAWNVQISNLTSYRIEYKMQISTNSMLYIIYSYT